MFVSSNDQGAEASIAELVGELGFAPVSLGKINEGGALIAMGGPLILQNLIRQG
jgi:predicted dinucleotide-binding enzyme